MDGDRVIPDHVIDLRVEAGASALDAALAQSAMLEAANAKLSEMLDREHALVRKPEVPTAS